MDERARKVDYFSIQTANKPGEGARILGRLRDAGVDLLAFTGFPEGRRAQIDFIPKETAKFKVAAKKSGLKLSPKKSGFLIQGADRVGAIAEIMERLASAKINITAIDALCAGEGRYGAILWVKPTDVSRAAKALGAS